jgi:hypothetical protein
VGEEEEEEKGKKNTDRISWRITGRKAVNRSRRGLENIRKL